MVNQSGVSQSGETKEKTTISEEEQDTLDFLFDRDGANERRYK